MQEAFRGKGEWAFGCKRKGEQGEDQSRKTWVNIGELAVHKTNAGNLAALLDQFPQKKQFYTTQAGFQKETFRLEWFKLTSYCQNLLKNSQISSTNGENCIMGV